MKSTEQQYRDMEREMKKAQLTYLAYFRGCLDELSMTTEKALLETIDRMTRDKYGFMKPIMFNITKYLPKVANEYPELNVDNRVFHEWHFEFTGDSNENKNRQDNKQ